MKYVIFTDGIVTIPVIIPDHCTHADVMIKGFKPVSAGYCSCGSPRFLNVSVDMKSYSESLKIGPNSVDEVVLNRLVSDCGTMFFTNSLDDIYLSYKK